MRQRPGFIFISIAMLLVFFLHACFFSSYGIFRDELYYFVCGQRLAWGYVDHPPLVAWISAVLGSVFHEKLIYYRFWSFTVSALHVGLVLVWLRQHRGGYLALSVTALALVIAPIRLGIDHFYSMNSLESLLWFAIFWLLSELTDLGWKRLCLLAVLMSAAILNKHSSAIYLALLCLGFFPVSRDRTTYLRRVIDLALATLVLLSPHMYWQAAHGWPTAEFQHNARVFKNHSLSVFGLFKDLTLQHHPLVLPLWLGALWILMWNTEWRRFRGYGLAFGAFLLLLLVGSGKAYYAVGWFSPLIAIASLEFEKYSAKIRWLYPVALVLGGLVTMPLALPILPVDSFIAYQKLLGIPIESGENQKPGVLPQHYADMFGWRELVEQVAQEFHRLPEQDQKKIAIYTQNYGQAAAIDYFGKDLGLPPASSGHNNYYLWGPQPVDASILLIVGGKAEDHQKSCGELRLLSVFDHPLRMPYERQLGLFLCRNLKKPIQELWPETKHFI